MKADAVFEGGGVRGIGFVGAIEALEENGYQWERLAGTSAGSIIASLLASGYTATELKSEITSLNYRKFTGETWINRIPAIGKWVEVLLHLGIYRNDYIETWVNALLHKKGIHTFGDLPYGKLKIVASDLTAGKMLVLPDDLDKYGITSATFPIARAVRMSISLPFFFQPVKWVTPQRQEPNYIVDGGILSNYPIWIFDVDGPPRWPTFGFRFTRQDIQGNAMLIHGPISMYKAMFQTMLQAHDLRHIDQHSEVRTIFIPTGTVTSTQFDLNASDREFLFYSGYDAAQTFLEDWDFTKYSLKYRT